MRGATFGGVTATSPNAWKPFRDGARAHPASRGSRPLPVHAMGGG